MKHKEKYLTKKNTYQNSVNMITFQGYLRHINNK